MEKMLRRIAVALLITAVAVGSPGCPWGQHKDDPPPDSHEQHHDDHHDPAR